MLLVIYMWSSKEGLQRVLGSTKAKLPGQAANFAPLAIAVLLSHLCGNTTAMSNPSRQVPARDSNVSCYDKDSAKLVSRLGNTFT